MHLAIERESDQQCYGKTGFLAKFAYHDYVDDDDQCHHWARRSEAGSVDSVPFAVYSVDMDWIDEDSTEKMNVRKSASTAPHEKPWAILGFFLYEGELFEVLDPSEGKWDLSARLKDIIRSLKDAKNRSQPIWRLRTGGPVYYDDATFRDDKGGWNSEVSPMDDSYYLVLERSGTHKGLKFAVYRDEYEDEEAEEKQYTIIAYDEKCFGLGLSEHQPHEATDAPPVFSVRGADAERYIDASTPIGQRSAAAKLARKPKARIERSLRKSCADC